MSIDQNKMFIKNNTGSLPVPLNINDVFGKILFNLRKTIVKWRGDSLDRWKFLGKKNCRTKQQYAKSYSEIFQNISYLHLISWGGIPQMVPHGSNISTINITGEINIHSKISLND